MRPIGEWGKVAESRTKASEGDFPPKRRSLRHPIHRAPKAKGRKWTFRRRVIRPGASTGAPPIRRQGEGETRRGGEGETGRHRVLAVAANRVLSVNHSMRVASYTKKRLIPDFLFPVLAKCGLGAVAPARRPSRKLPSLSCQNPTSHGKYARKDWCGSSRRAKFPCTY